MEAAWMEEVQGPTVGEPMRNGESSVGSVKKSRELPDLPEACIARILSCLPPREVAKAACVCKSYHLVSQCDTVWGSLLPPHHMDVLDLITDPKPVFRSKKDIYNYLTTPKFFAEGTKVCFVLLSTPEVYLSLHVRTPSTSPSLFGEMSGFRAKAIMHMSVNREPVEVIRKGIY
jgi:hypothetical protein